MLRPANHEVLHRHPAAPTPELPSKNARQEPWADRSIQVCILWSDGLYATSSQGEALLWLANTYRFAGMLLMQDPKMSISRKIGDLCTESSATGVPSASITSVVISPIVT